eukprot:s2984_g7.t1
MCDCTAGLTQRECDEFPCPCDEILHDEDDEELDDADTDNGSDADEGDVDSVDIFVRKAQQLFSERDAMSEEQLVAAAAAHGNPAAVPAADSAAAESADRHGDGHDPAAPASAADLVPAEPPAPVAPARPKALPVHGAGRAPPKAAAGPRMVHEGLVIRKADSDDTLSLIKIKPRANDAYTKCPFHADCSKTKTLNRGRVAQQGRPLGFLAAWCLAGSSFATKDEHILTCFPSRAERQRARCRLHEEPNSQSFFAKERPAESHEDSEPELCP